MKLEHSDKSQLFSCTEIPDVFFTEYVPSMNGNFLKVYLYVLFLSKYNKDVKINDLSKRLGLSFPDVQDALKYLEEQKLLIKLPDGYSVANIQELELSKLYSPKITSSPEDIERSRENQYRAQAIENINTLFFQGVMNSTWYIDIDFWFNKYGFDEQVMLALFNYCAENRALNRGYIQTVADSWAKNNIKTFNDLDEYETKKDKLNVIKKEIASRLRLSRNLTSFDEDYIIKWTTEYNYDISIIELALKKSSSMNSISFEYFDRVLSDWHEKGLNTVEDILTYQQSQKDKTKKIKQIEKKIPEYSYTQSTFDNLESLYDN
jgi:DnaD/phage-associated family protein